KRNRSGTDERIQDEKFLSWKDKRIAILNKYTTTEKLSIATVFKGNQAVTTVEGKVKQRLEELNNLNEDSAKELLNLNQNEFIQHIDNMNQALINAWEADQRVKTLKIAIQCAKLLNDVSVIQFYPSKFVLVTDVLDTFGFLVYDRLRRNCSNLSLTENFSPNDVPDQAKETCRNWFYKVASIRELIPRFYLECAILRCYKYISLDEHKRVLIRLARTIAGIGDPLVAAYARAYLCRVGILVTPSLRDYCNLCLTDFFKTYSQLSSDAVQNTLASQGIGLVQYFDLYSPAVEWVLKCCQHDATDNLLIISIINPSALVLNSMLVTLKAEFVSKRAQEFVELIKGCVESGFSKHNLFANFGMSLIEYPPMEDQKLPVLSEVWKIVMKYKDPADYMACASVWIEYPAKYFSVREVNKLLDDIIKHLQPDRAFEHFYPQLHSIVIRMLDHLHDFNAIFSMDKFLPFLDMFQKDSTKLEVFRIIIDCFNKYQEDAVNDPMVVNGLIFVSKSLHDSVNSLALEDSKREISNLITAFIQKVDFGRDFEQQLNFYVDARSFFTALDAVVIQLVQCFNSLAMNTLEVVKGSHTHKTSSFVRACIANCFITIPSITNIFDRLQLYLLSAEVAVINQAYPQADDILKATIQQLLQIPRTMEIDNRIRSTEPKVLDYLSQLLGFLQYVPDNPDQGALYLLKGLLNVLQKYHWDSDLGKIKMYIKTIGLLSAMCQDGYLYQLKNVDSNDKLYGQDKKFIAEVLQIIDTLHEEIRQYMQSISSKEVRIIRSVYFLFNSIISHADLSDQQMMSFAIKLWNIVKKQGCVDAKVIVSMK
ncbi:uncharacterized protein TRIADDRAFT_28863, partial [Trichoplax adhaerens]